MNSSQSEFQNTGNPQTGNHLLGIRLSCVCLSSTGYHLAFLHPGTSCLPPHTGMLIHLAPSGLLPHTYGWTNMQVHVQVCYQNGEIPSTQMLQVCTCKLMVIQVTDLDRPVCQILSNALIQFSDEFIPRDESP